MCVRLFLIFVFFLRLVSVLSSLIYGPYLLESTISVGYLGRSFKIPLCTSYDRKACGGGRLFSLFRLFFFFLSFFRRDSSLLFFFPNLLFFGKKSDGIPDGNFVLIFYLIKLNFQNEQSPTVWDTRSPFSHVTVLLQRTKNKAMKKIYTEM